jgi:UDP-N-acetylmuramate: L-alanyl-gamma-D-glutamyl-meso-diaminopimelate ligase
MIGGQLQNFGQNYRIGRPGYFVVEGDEYDTAYFDKGPKFLHYRPRSAIITSVEFDHADIYRDVEHVKSSFRQFIELIPEDGRLIACTDYEHLRVLLPSSKVPPLTYGIKGESEYSGYIEEATPTGMRFVVTRAGGPIANFQTSLVGKHNLLNLIAVTVLLKELGLPLHAIEAGIASFEGVRRRQEVFAELGGVTLVDDFAHHPTAVQVTIEAVRQRFAGRRLWAVFEPRSATSRRKVFQDRYTWAFTGAHQVIIADVYNAALLAEEDRFSPGELVEALQGRGVEARALPTVDDIVATLAAEVEPGDVVLIMSNGGFGGIYQKLPAALAARGFTPSDPAAG